MNNYFHTVKRMIRILWRSEINWKEDKQLWQDWQEILKVANIISVEEFNLLIRGKGVYTLHAQATPEEIAQFKARLSKRENDLYKKVHDLLEEHPKLTIRTIRLVCHVQSNRLNPIVRAVRNELKIDPKAIRLKSTRALNDQFIEALESESK